MIDFKKISIGTILTIGTIIGTFIYTQGIFTSKVDSFEKEQVTHAKRIDGNSSNIVKLKVSVAKVETKIDEGFKRLEDLLIEMKD